MHLFTATRSYCELRNGDVDFVPPLKPRAQHFGQVLGGVPVRVREGNDEGACKRDTAEPKTCKIG